MLKKFKILCLLGFALLLSGCIVNATPTPQPSQIASATSTLTPTAAIIYVTATSDFDIPVETEPEETLPEETQPDEVTSTPTLTPAAGSASISIVQVEDKGGGQAIVDWNKTGNFPSGFVVVWSSTNNNPTYPNDQYSYTADPSSNSAMITANTHQVYYLRVCRFVNNACDVYSNLAIFALTASGTTPIPGETTTSSAPTPLPTAYNSTGGIIHSSTSITISKISDTNTNKARIDWFLVGTIPDGFKITYSTSSAYPYVGGYPYYVISDSTSRFAYVDGTPGKTYYFRVCRINGSSCDIYSNSYSYKFPGTAATVTPDSSVIKINSITDSTPGKATIKWSATGSFPNGFKILYSKTNQSPTLSDLSVSVSNGSLRSTQITGDPGSAYYVRVCKFDGSNTCQAYSPVKTFTFTSVITLTGISNASDTQEGAAQVKWDAQGNFPNGFKILYSTTVLKPTYPHTGVLDVTVNNGSARSGTFIGDPSTLYHVRICQIVNSTCGVYSNVFNFTFPADNAYIHISSITDAADLGDATIDWLATGVFAKGFKIVYSNTIKLPTLADQVVTVSDGALRTATMPGVPDTQYHVRICKFFNNDCTVYSDPMDFTFAKDPAILLLSTITDATPGFATIVWTGTTTKGDFSEGFNILASTTNTQPVFADTVAELRDGSTGPSFTALFPGASDTNYYVRVCKILNGGCAAYSDTRSFTFAHY